MAVGFNNELYLQKQAENILKRIQKFDNKLYLEFGGKIFDDLHAARILPGFDPNVKTKMLLSAAEAAEAETELDLLRQSLIERQRREAMEQIRMAITVLEPRNEVGRCLFTKQPEPLRRDETYRYQHEPEDMLRALDEIAERNQRRLPPPTVNFKGIVGKEPYPVAKKATELIRRLVLRGIDRLKNLFKGSKSRSEIVATFMAILELCKTNSVILEDDDTGENPNVRLIKEPENEIEEMT